MKPKWFAAVVPVVGVVALALHAFRSKPTLESASTAVSVPFVSPAPPATSTAMVAKVAPLFVTTVENSTHPVERAPTGMVWIPGGEFSMGAQDPPEANDRVGMHAIRDSRPIHRVYVDGFFMDKTEVTNAEFARFVKATGYITLAERTPRPEDLPGVAAEDRVPGSLVFSAPEHAVPLNDHSQWWANVNGASWRHPLGPESSISGKEKFPVVQVAYEDALAYARWAKKRLPTEAEWEFAARGGLTGKVYPWGDEFRKDGAWMANTYQGHFPDKDTGADRFAGVAPVAEFPPNGYGLYDVAGNVWEWVTDRYRPDYYAELAATGEIARNPRGPSTSVDPDEPGVEKRVHRGGSFLCTEQFCSRYMVGTRGKGDVGTGTNHLGFRTVMSPVGSATAKTLPRPRASQVGAVRRD